MEIGGGGTGSAGDATVSTDPADAPERVSNRAELEAAVETAKVKVEKRRFFLAAAEQALAEAEAALEGAN